MEWTHFTEIIFYKCILLDIMATKKVRCKKGTRRNKKTGECEEKQTTDVQPQPVIVVKDSLEQYFEKLSKKINIILSRNSKEIFTYDILDTELIKNNKLIYLKEKQRQMKIGEIWQEVLGSYHGFVNLGIGHKTGLDIISHEKKIVVELKNRTNTDNASSKKANLDKLSKFKKENPDYICIYGTINDNTEKKTIPGTIKNIIHNGVEIKQYIGMKLLTFILEENTTKIIEFVKQIIDEKSRIL